MPTKTTTATPAPGDTPAAPAVQAARNEPAPTPQRVRVLRHGIEAAGLICAAGAVITVPAEVAAVLIADGAGSRIY